MNRLYLVRHGENLANLTYEFSYNKVDYSLTPKGQLQAAQTAAFFTDKHVDEVYASPLKRALETAQAIAQPAGLPVIPSEAFREINVGDLEGQPPTAALWGQHNVIVAGWQDGHPELCFPGGENYFSLLDRVRAGLVEILRGKQNRTIVVVGHGGIFTFPLRDLCTGVDQDILALGMPNCSIITLEAQLVEDQLEARLLSHASTAHLSGEAARLVSGIMTTSAVKPE